MAMERLRLKRLHGNYLHSRFRIRVCNIGTPDNKQQRSRLTQRMKIDLVASID